jgi:uncharacterized protein (DUF1501 family)
MTTRRDFMKTVFVGGGTGVLAPSLFSSAVRSACASGLDPSAPADVPILVVVQMSGGNDGVNTVVPLGDDHYRRARKRLALAEKECLRVQDGLGLHPSLNGLKELYDAGQVTILNGVGYPNPNRSHFRSMEIWHTASDADRYEQHGWLGKYFDTHCRDLDASVGINIGKRSPQAFSASMPKGLSFREARELKMPRPGGGGGMFEAWEDMNALDEEENAGASIGSLSGGHHRGRTLSPLAYIEETARAARDGSRMIQDALRASRTHATFPRTRLGRDCSTVAKLIAADMPTRVYYISIGGFDTHANQLGTHQRLLSEFSDAMKQLVNELAEQGNLNRVCILAFSEFGRRVQENANGGTDHGAAGPMFVFGGQTPGGVLGTYPSLAPGDLKRGDLSFGIDFRSVYASLIGQHLGVNSESVLGREFKALPGLFKS